MTSRIIAIANQKGGVGKTTLTLGLAGAVAHSGRRVLVIDMDAQSNASQVLLPDYASLIAENAADFFSTNDILVQGADPEDIVDAIRPSAWANVDVIPARQELANRDADGTTGIDMRLRRMLRGLPADTYDLVLLDCPPAVGRLTVNALVAAHEVLLVVTPSAFGQNALTQIEETLQVVRDSYDSPTEVLGLVVNEYQRSPVADHQLALIAERFGDRLLLTMGHRSVLEQAAATNTSIFAMPRRKSGVTDTIAWFTGLAQLIGLVEGVPATVPPVAESAK